MPEVTKAITQPVIDDGGNFIRDGSNDVVCRVGPLFSAEEVAQRIDEHPDLAHKLGEAIQKLEDISYYAKSNPMTAPDCIQDLDEFIVKLYQ